MPCRALLVLLTTAALPAGAVYIVSDHGKTIALEGFLVNPVLLASPYDAALNRTIDYDQARVLWQMNRTVACMRANPYVRVEEDEHMHPPADRDAFLQEVAWSQALTNTFWKDKRRVIQALLAASSSDDATDNWEAEGETWQEAYKALVLKLGTGRLKTLLFYASMASLVRDDTPSYAFYAD